MKTLRSFPRAGSMKLLLGLRRNLGSVILEGEGHLKADIIATGSLAQCCIFVLRVMGCGSDKTEAHTMPLIFFKS